MRIRDLRVLFFKLYIPIYNILDTRLKITYREKKKKRDNILQNEARNSFPKG